MVAEVLLLAELDAELAHYCASHLCRPGSEMSDEFRRHRTFTPVNICYDGDNAQPIGWVATHVWRGQQTIEGFTHKDYRRRGIARIGVQMLLACHHLDKREPVSVFAPECVELAYSVGWTDVRFWERFGVFDWREVRA